MQGRRRAATVSGSESKAWSGGEGKAWPISRGSSIFRASESASGSAPRRTSFATHRRGSDQCPADWWNCAQFERTSSSSRPLSPIAQSQRSSSSSQHPASDAGGSAHDSTHDSTRDSIHDSAHESGRDSCSDELSCRSANPSMSAYSCGSSPDLQSSTPIADHQPDASATSPPGVSTVASLYRQGSASRFEWWRRRALEVLFGPLASVDDEREGYDRLVAHPQNRLRVAFEIVLAGFTTFTAIACPLQAAFELPGLDPWLIASYVLFLCDSVLQLFFGYEERNNLSRHPLSPSLSSSLPMALSIAQSRNSLSS